MNIYTERPPMVETERMFNEFATAIHMDARELTVEEIEARFPEGFPVEEGQETPTTLWTATDYFIYHSTPQPDRSEVKKIIDNHINARTDERILSGFVWTPPATVPDDSPSAIHVWLSEENQRNFSEAQRVAMITNGQSLPMTFKLGEDADGNPVYHVFSTIEELTGFYLQAVAYINQCLNEGWTEKDSINIEESSA